jgi:hypothetical protein
VNWFGLPDPDAGLAELRAQLEADGWVEEAEMTMPNPFGTMTSVTFRKGDVERGLVVTRLSEHTKIMLVEKIEKRD